MIYLAFVDLNDPDNDARHYGHKCDICGTVAVQGITHDTQAPNPVPLAVGWVEHHTVEPQDRRVDKRPYIVITGAACPTCAVYAHDFTAAMLARDALNHPTRRIHLPAALSKANA